MAALYSSIYNSFDWDRYLKLTELFELNPKKPIANFSKGMKRQAAIILALSTRAKYMFFDETFDGLDPVMRNLVKKLICNDVAEYNATVIVTSHLKTYVIILHFFTRAGLYLTAMYLSLKHHNSKYRLHLRTYSESQSLKDLT